MFSIGCIKCLPSTYATNVVKRSIASLSYRNEPALILDSDDDDDREDQMDPITFARYYAAQNPHLAKIVQDHDDNLRERLVEGIASWVKGFQSETL
jgi:hypothetical protein